MPSRRTKEGTGALCRVERNHVIWRGLRPEAWRKCKGGAGLGDLSLILWAMPDRHIDHNEVGEDVDKYVGQMMEIRRKTREQQMCASKLLSPTVVMYDFCLKP